ncbi:MAG: cytidylate kinase-like family protein [Phycisphaerae bacterium]|nr:cytidylate kinase-like family protein [Phycisphaerae bacterium]
MKRQITADGSLGNLVERQMRNWEIARSQKRADPVSTGLQPVEQFICISRAVGLPGEKVACKLLEATGWPMFDREILAIMSGDEEYRRQIYSSLDERDLNWLSDFVMSLTKGLINREDYFHRLSATISALARKGHAIFLGRAADLILPRDLGLRVRFTANRDYCIREFARLNRIEFDYAARQVEEIEHDRTRFLKTHFKTAADDLSRFDLVINMEHLSIDQATEVILTAARAKSVIESPAQAPSDETRTRKPTVSRV